MALWDRFFGSAGSQAVGVAFGATAVPALLPAAQYLINESWQSHPDKPLLAAELAVGVAQGKIDLKTAHNEATMNGINNGRFDMLVAAAKAGPGVTSAMDLWRRGEITDGQFTGALQLEGIQDGWITHLAALKEARLSPAQVALAIVRSLMDSHGLLVGENDTTGGLIAPTPKSPIDALTEAEDAGIDKERLRIMVNSIGLPMALDAAAQSVFRGIIHEPDFYLAVAQGDTRPAWADAILEHARQIPSVSDYVNAYLRGWITEAEMNAGAARHGMSADDVHLLYLRSGRPAAPGQMATAAARGIDGPDGRPMDREQFLKGIKESDIRPEWGPMLWESRFLYPPLFQITRLVQAGAITAETARDWAVKDRYPPEVTEPLYEYWSQPAATSTKQTHEEKAQNQLWTAAHRAYLTGELSDPDALSALAAAGVPQAERSPILALWTHEANVKRAMLTPAQIKKAYAKGAVNALTGVAWTRDEAFEALRERGYNVTEANDYLNLP